MGETTGETPELSGSPGLDATTKRCPGCGETFSGETHKQCVTPGGTVKRSPSSKSRLDDIPAEALPFDVDPGRQLNQYLLVKQIGKGGMGTVWKAWDRKLTRWVAIKFLVATEEEDIARFQREAKLAARLRHPNIAPIYEVGEEPARQAGQTPRHYLAMEYIDGQSMSSAATNLPMNVLLEIFLKITQGIEAAHKAGVVHRDLKPQNIMLTSDGWPYVMDFGLAKALQTESSISVSGAVMGTPAYMPPEQAQGELDKVDAQSDVYSLGATIYAVLCKKQPFAGKNPMEVLMKVCKDDPPSPRSINPQIPESIEAIILKAMSKEKADRYASASALGEDLKRYLSDEEVTARGPTSLQLAARKMRRNVWPVVCALLLAVLAAGAVAVATRKPRRKDPPPTPVVSPDVGLEKIAQWKREWQEERKKIRYSSFKGDEPGLAPAIREHLSGLKDLPAVEANEIKDWFQGELSEARRDVAEWEPRPPAERLKRRGDAERVVRWCDTLQAALAGVDELAKAADEAAALRQQALPLSLYRGTFTLRVFVMDARVTALRKAGAPLSLAGDPATPYVSLLDVDDYEVEIAHAQGNETVALKGVAAGRVYTVVGKPKSLRVVTP